MATEGEEYQSIIREEKFQTTPLREREKRLKFRGILSLPKHRLEQLAESTVSPYGSWDITNVVYKEFLYAIEDDSNLVTVLYGRQNSGKSVVAKTLAIYVQKAWKKIGGIKGRLFLTYSFWETIEAIRQARCGDAIIQDETDELTGEGAISTLRRLNNILKRFRAKQIFVFFLSPVKITIQGVCSMYLQVDSKRREDRRTKAIVYSGETMIPLGFAKIKLREDSEAFKDYQNDKAEEIEEIILNAGYSVVHYPQAMLRRHYDEVVLYMKDRFPQIPMRKWKAKFIKLAILVIPIPGDSVYRSIVEGEVLTKIYNAKAEYELKKEEARRKKKEEEMKKLASMDLSVNKLENSCSSTEVVSNFDDHLRRVAAGYLVQKGYADSVNNAMRWCLRKLTVKKLSYPEIAEMLEEKRSDSVAQYIRRFRKLSKTDTGNILEIALYSYLIHKIPALSEAFVVAQSSQDTLSNNQAQKVRFVRGSGPGSCDLHLIREGKHLLCINAKLKLERRPSWSIKIHPEFENNPDNSFGVLWDPEKGLQVYKAQSETVNTGSCADISMNGLIEAIQSILR